MREKLMKLSQTQAALPQLQMPSVLGLNTIDKMRGLCCESGHSERAKAITGKLGASLALPR
jgi:hypothetical protein